MKRILRAGGAISIVVLAAAIPSAALAAPVSQAPVLNDAKVQHRYVVTTSSATSSRTAAVGVRRNGGHVESTFDTVLTGFAATLDARQVQRLRGQAGVRSVTLDAIVHSTGLQSKPTWGLDRIDQRSMTGNGSYRYDTTGAGVTAFVIDTGVRFAHTQFGGRAVSGYDFAGGDTNAADCAGHGTHVSGTIGGSTYGVAKGVRIVALRVLGCDGSGYVSDVIDALDWTVAHKPSGPAVVNLSLGADAYGPLDEAVERTVAAGIPVVVAAGNDGDSACTHSPARAPHAITVAATDAGDTRPYWSNDGSCVDLFAPGVDVRSASNASNTATEVMSGTSMATPHVAGAVARYLQRHPTATPAQVTSALVAAATTRAVRDPAGSPDRLLYVAPQAATVPGVPTSVSASTSTTARTGTLRWSPPASTGGQPVTGYRVSRNGLDSRGAGPVTLVVPASQRSVTFSRLRPGSWYALTVRAVNATGPGAAVSKTITSAW